MIDKFEFMLRYMGYEGLNEKFNFGWDEKTLLNLSNRTDQGQMTKKLVETSPDELKELTIKTYTDYKKNFIKEQGDKKINEQFTLGDYIERLEYEYKVVHEMGYNTYFLIVQDYIMYAKKAGIVVGPGRGSAAGSLLGYLVRITEIDPMEYDLLFERFLNPARISMPDVDTDFEDTERDKILEYVKKVYGVEKVAQIGTYMTMAAKAAFKDVARTFGLSFTKSNLLSNYIEKSIDKSYNENEEFKALVDEDENLKKIVELSSRLEGTVRQVGVHACGVVISPEEIQTYTPVQHPPKSGQKGEQDSARIVSQYDGHYLEDIGLLKMDFLGLRNLSIIKNTIKILKAKLPEGEKLPDLYEDFFEYMVFEPPLDDDKTLELFRQGNTSGVFQFESDGMRAWLRNLKPTSIDDVVAMVALYRPGPMEWIPNYIDRKSGKEKISYLPEDVYKVIKEKYSEEEANKQREMITEDLKGFMDVTYGISVYQEQLMRIVQSMAGFSLGEADLLRRGVGKKIMEVIQQLKKDFIDKSASYKGYKEEVSTFVYEKMIEPAANYSFNKSHAVCYAIIAYQTAYLKAHHPVEYHAALLRSVEENTEKLAELIDELKIKGYNVSSPNINKSYSHVAAVEDEIIIGFVAAKGLGYDVAKIIEKERISNGEFSSLEDFLVRCDDIINKKSLEALAKSGALDKFEDRKIIIENMDLIQKRIKGRKEHQETSSMGLFGDELLESSALKLKPGEKANTMENLRYEYETIGTFLSSHPFDGLYSYMKSKSNFTTQIQDEKYSGEFNVTGIIKVIRKNAKFGGFWVTVEDIVGTMDIYMKSLGSLKMFDVVSIKGKYDMVERKGEKPGEKIQKKRRLISQINKINLDKYIEKVKKNGRYKEDEKVVLVRHNRMEAQKKKDAEEAKRMEEQKAAIAKMSAVSSSNAKEEEISVSSSTSIKEEKDSLTSSEDTKKDKEIEIMNEELDDEMDEELMDEELDDEIMEEDSENLSEREEESNVNSTVNEKEDEDNGLYGTLEEKIVFEEELPDNIDDIMKIIELKKANTDKEYVQFKGKYYKI